MQAIADRHIRLVARDCRDAPVTRCAAGIDGMQNPGSAPVLYLDDSISRFGQSTVLVMHNIWFFVFSVFLRYDKDDEIHITS